MTYADRVLATRPANLLAYWKLNDAGAPQDSSGHGYNGNGYLTVRWQRWIGEETVFRFNTVDGYSSYVNIYSTGLRDAFNGSTGTVMFWFRFIDAATWANTHSFRYLFRISTGGGGDSIYIRQSSNLLHFSYVTDISVRVDIDVAPPAADTCWHQLILTYDKTNDEVRAFCDGEQLGATASGMGTWNGTLSNGYCYIGAYSAGGGMPTWDRLIGHVVVWNAVLTPEEIKTLAWVDLWTDRTAADLTARTFKAFWNIEDWMRVNRAAKWVHDQILTYDGVDVTLNALTVPTIETFPAAGDINDLVENIELLHQAVGFPSTLGLVTLHYDYAPGVGAVAPDYEDVNAWENNLQLMKGALDNSAPNYIHCGVASAGQTRLFQSRWRS